MKKFVWIAVVLLAALGLGQAAHAQTESKSLLSGDLYRIDRTHSMLSFTAWHVGFSRVRGTFKSYDVALYFVEDDILKSSVSVEIDVDTVDSNSAGRDGQLRKEFFDIATFPLIHFRSERVEADGTGFVLIGPLTVRDVTREVRLPFRVVTPKGRDQFGHTRITFTGGLTLNRKDYDVIYANNSFWDGIASDEIEIEIDLSMVIDNRIDSVFPQWRTENSVGKLALEIVEKEGVEAARRQVLQLWNDEREDYDFRFSQLYKAGLILSQEKRYSEAITIFKLLEKTYTGSPEEDEDGSHLAALNTAIGEAYAHLGDRRNALHHAENAVELYPRHLRAQELLRHLDSQPQYQGCLQRRSPRNPGE